jgi:predicted Zn finger-like uncharacterized protein
MRFVCDSCRAQYMISDDKIGAKGVKIRCKKCGHVIVVRPAGAAAPKDDGSSEASASESTATTATHGAANANASMLASLGTPPEGGLFTGVEEDEIGAVFDQVLNSGSQKIASGDSAGDKAKESKSSTPDAVRKLAEAEDQPDEPKAAAPANDWFVAIDEKQVGPLTVDKIKEHWDRGEVGPDSLCWRAGFSDWIPLSEARDLASVLAPRPAKPVIVAPAAVAASASGPSAPVESAFSAGAAAKNNRPEIPAAPALGQEPTSSGWKPSAASVLASLVKEENDALSKPPPKPAVEEKPSAPGLLDLPPPEPAMAPSARAAPMMAAAAEPMRAPQSAPMPYAPAQAPAYAQPAPAYGQPAYAGGGYPQPAYPGYPPPTAPGAQGGNKTVMYAAIGGVALLLLLVGAFFAMKGSNNQATEPTPVAVVNTPPPAKAPEPATPPAAKVETPPSAAVANPATPPAAPAVAATPPPVPAAGTAAGGSTATPAVVPTPPPSTPPTPPAATEAVAKVTPGTREPSTKTGERKPPSESSRPNSNSGSSKSEAVAKPSKPADDGLGDDFDDLFGTKKPASGGKQQGSQSGSSSTYIPPEPGGGANVPERLGQSDIMAVVVANKPAIVKCVNEQKKKDPGLTGRLVMRWVIQPNGKTSGVSVKSEEFKKTYMASCISGLIKGWNFPKHKKQGDPIDFPFIF